MATSGGGTLGYWQQTQLRSSLLGSGGYKDRLKDGNQGLYMMSSPPASERGVCFLEVEVVTSAWVV